MTDEEINALEDLSSVTDKCPWGDDLRDALEEDGYAGCVIKFILAANPTAIRGLIERLLNTQNGLQRMWELKDKAEAERDEAYHALDDMATTYRSDLWDGAFPEHVAALSKARAFVEGDKD